MYDYGSVMHYEDGTVGFRLDVCIEFLINYKMYDTHLFALRIVCHQSRDPRARRREQQLPTHDGQPHRTVVRRCESDECALRMQQLSEV